MTNNFAKDLEALGFILQGSDQYCEVWYNHTDMYINLATHTAFQNLDRETEVNIEDLFTFKDHLTGVPTFFSFLLTGLHESSAPTRFDAPVHLTIYSDKECIMPVLKIRFSKITRAIEWLNMLMHNNF